MKVRHDGDRPTGGLRARKKARTRAAIQQHALRLFREQGYEATTIDQIAEQAEISPSTFFRYFPTKEDVVLYDNLDPLMLAAFKEQPADLTVAQAVRAAMHEVFSNLSADDVADIRDRIILVAAVPELRARALDELIRTIQTFGRIIAQRQARQDDDFPARVVTGAIVGVAMAVMLALADDPTQDFVALLDQGLAQLENGLSL